MYGITECKKQNADSRTLNCDDAMKECNEAIGMRFSESYQTLER